MSGQYCLVCKLKRQQFQDIHHADGELWTFPDLVSIANKIAASKSKSPIDGVKKEPWWPFLNINHHMVPLLHVEIGIGNNLLDKFCHVTTVLIEKLSMKEIQLMRTLGTYKKIIDETVTERKEFDKSPDGTKMKSLKGKISSRRRKLNALPTKEIEDDGNESDETESNSENEEDDNGRSNGDETNAILPHEQPFTSSLPLVTEISNLELELKPLATTRKGIVDRLNATKGLAAKAQDKLSEMQRCKVRKSVSLETQIYEVLKKVGVQVQAYHGGSLNGKDIIKVMNNATYLFDEFAKILQSGKRDDCELSDADIDVLCRDFRVVFVLWDGAISYSRKENPDPNDIMMYRRFVRAAVDGHVKLGLSVTPKVHLMHKHVEPQMTNITGGMGNKMEDGLERSHQTGGRSRLQFARVSNVHTRAVAKQRYAHRSTNPEVVQQMMEVEAASQRKFTRDRNDRENVEEIPERERAEIRSRTIEDYEEGMEENNDGNKSLTFLSRLLMSDTVAAAAPLESTTISGESS